MREKSIKAYVRGSIFMKEAVRKVLVERKGASTVEYVAVLAGAALLGGAVMAAVKGEDGAAAKIKKKITDIVSDI
ncbi:hypothetical protein [Paludifilum halophilum]|uniref:DUF4244 domain-containing protein n=1 Tax=Paludifilum halophilum TaxID=1642702 RepID=A0A235B207_9BACL|nr:hypothetical protein [Paludifilum halophilum]OYD06323.1 hypothetical protein CHM34_16530 [Paludifilum halophilum]